TGDLSRLTLTVFSVPLLPKGHERRATAFPNWPGPLICLYWPARAAWQLSPSVVSCAGSRTSAMTIHLPEDLAGPIPPEVLSGQFASEDELVAAAVRDYLRRKHEHAPPGPGMGSIGAMRDDDALLDQVTQLIMQGRQTRTLRLGPDE